MPAYEFSRKAPLFLNITCPSGSVEVTAEERDNVEVSVTPMDSSRQDREAAESTSVVLIGDELTIEPPKGSTYLRSNVRLKIEVHTPIESSVKANVASAWLKCIGRFRDVNVTTASGEVEVGDTTGSVRIRTSSGDSRFGDIRGKLTARTSSANMSFGSVSGSSTVRTSSGNVKISVLNHDLKYRSASGKLEIDSIIAGDITAQSSSGDFQIGADRSSTVWLELQSKSGSVNTGIESTAENQRSSDISLRVRTESGDIKVDSAE